jgi:predicted permease
MIPTVLIMLLLLVAFILAQWRYYSLDPKKRVFEVSFIVMVLCCVIFLGYPIEQAIYDSALISCLSFAAAIVLTIVAFATLRRYRKMLAEQNAQKVG